MGGGSAFASEANPTVMVRVGEPGAEGIMEITDIIFATKGSSTCPGTSEEGGCRWLLTNV